MVSSHILDYILLVKMEVECRDVIQYGSQWKWRHLLTH